MPIAELDGVDLFYQDSGSGPPLIFLHGGGGSHAIWERQVPYFAERFRVIAVDQRGFGASRPTDASTIGDTRLLESDLTDLVDTLALDHELTIVGHSLGTHPALGFAQQHPNRLKSLVLSSAYGGLSSPTLDEYAAARLRTVREAEQAVAESGAPPDSPGKQGGSNLTAELIKFAGAGRRPSLADLRRCLETSRPISENEIATGFSTLLLAGEHDHFAPNELKEAARLLRGADLEIISGAAHASYSERPDLFNAKLQSFFDRTR